MYSYAPCGILSVVVYFVNIYTNKKDSSMDALRELCLGVLRIVL